MVNGLYILTDGTQPQSRVRVRGRTIVPQNASSGDVRPNTGDLLRKSADGASPAKGAPKAWHEGASTGDERWITIHPGNGDSERYVHVKVKLRGNGKWRIVAGGEHLEHQEIVPRSQLSPEKQKELDAKKDRIKQLRTENAKMASQHNAIKEQHARELGKVVGMASELPAEARQAVTDKAKRQAAAMGVDDVGQYVAKQVAGAEAKHKQAFGKQLQRALLAANEVERSDEPDKAIEQILNRDAVSRDEDIDIRAAEIAAAPADDADPKLSDAQEGAMILQAEGVQPMTDGQLVPSELVSPGQPVPDLRTKPLYQPQRIDLEAILRDPAKRRQLLALKMAASQTEREYRASRNKLGAEGASGTSTLAQFQISAEAAGTEEAERAVLSKFEDKERSRLNSSLINFADSTYDQAEGKFKAYGKKQYSVGKAQITGALDALTGIAEQFLGGSMIDRPLVESLGVEGSAMLVAREIAAKVGPAGVDAVIAEMEDYHKQNALRIADVADKSTKIAEEQSASVKKMAEGELFDKDGRPVPGRLIAQADATRLLGELKAEALRQTGTALGSLHASATIMQLLRSTKTGSKLDTLRLNIADPGDEDIINKNLRLRGRYTVTSDPDTGSTQMVIHPSALKQFTHQAKADDARSQAVKDIQDGTAKTNIRELPTMFNKEWVDADGHKQPFQWMEPQKRAVDFLVAQSDENGGGGVIDLEVGGGKTSMAQGYIGFLKDKGFLRSGERALYVAPDEGLCDQVVEDADKFTKFRSSVVPGTQAKTMDDLRRKYSGDEDLTVVSAKRLSADVTFMEKQGYTPGQIGEFFRNMGFQCNIFDEAHKLVSGASGGGNIGRNMRKLQGRYNVAMTGTLATNAISQPFDMVRWASGAKVDSRAKVLRKYGEVGQGTEAWQQNVNNDVRRQIDPYILHGSGAISAKLLPPVEHQVELSDTQKSQLAEVTRGDSQRRKEFRDKQTAQGKAVTGDDTMSLRNQYQREVYNVLHNGDWHENPRLQAIGDDIQRIWAANPGRKFVVCTDKMSSAGLNSFEQMLRDRGMGDDSSIARFASKTLDGKGISAKRMQTSKLAFNTDPGTKFALLSETHAIGKNLQGGDYVIHLDTPPDAAAAKQRRGRAYRTMRTGDVQEMYYYTPDHSFDIERRLNLKRTGGLLGAVTD